MNEIGRISVNFSAARVLNEESHGAFHAVQAMIALPRCAAWRGQSSTFADVRYRRHEPLQS
jgi:hypothetical protein